LGAAMPDPAGPTQPFAPVWVTVYVPAAVTVIDDDVAPVLQAKVPVALVDNLELPQLSTSVTDGAAGIVLGAAMADPAGLVQPFAPVWVTEYVPPAVIVIDDVVAPVLQANVPEALVDNVELPQLSTSVTKGAEGMIFGAAVPEPAAPVHPFMV